MGPDIALMRSRGSDRLGANKVFLFMNARDEPSVPEWVAHHVLLGFTHIYIFDHKSKIPLSRLGTFGGKVTIIPKNLPDGSDVKMPLMETALHMARAGGAAWMVYLDADEYLCLNHRPTVQSFLANYAHADAVSVNWLMFGTSHHVYQPDGLIMTNFTHSDRTLDLHVKTFVRPQMVRSSINPHFYVMLRPNNLYHMCGAKMPHMGPKFKSPAPTYAHARAYIAHYMVQSEAEFRRRKGRPMDDGTGDKTGIYAHVHRHHNEVHNTCVSDKYARGILDFLAKRTGPRPRSGGTAQAQK